MSVIKIRIACHKLTELPKMDMMENVFLKGHIHWMSCPES